MALDTIATQAEVTIVDSLDWERVRELSLMALEESPCSFGLTLEEKLRKEPKSWIEHLDSLSSRTFLLDTEQLIGLATIKESNNPAEALLYGTWVAPKSRGLGAGDLLIQTAIEYAIGFGYQRIILSVGSDNHPAQALYERHGFVKTGLEAPQPMPRQHVREIQLALTLPHTEFLEIPTLASEAPDPVGLLN